MRLAGVVRAMDDDHRAGGAAHAAFTDRAKQESFKPTHALATDYQKIGALGGVEQHDRRVAAHNFDAEIEVGLDTKHRRDCTRSSNCTRTKKMRATSL